METRITVNTLFLLATFLFAYSAQADGYSKINSWQLAQLFEPEPHQLRAEQNGRIMIYSGLKDTDVQRAMDTQYDRIESMMFTSIVVTDDSGEPQLDPVTGSIIVEDDGC